MRLLTTAGSSKLFSACRLFKVDLFSEVIGYLVQSLSLKGNSRDFCRPTKSTDDDQGIMITKDYGNVGL